MTSHVRDYPSSQDVIIPWNRRYTFPTIANKAEKVTSRIQPRALGPFIPQNQIQIDMPAQGYLNTANTFLEFDVAITGTPTTNAGIRFQNNIQSIFDRVEIKYGSSPLEDVTNAGLIVRCLTEWTATAGQTFDQTSINEGIGGIVTDEIFAIETPAYTANVNIRQKYIQGIDSYARGDGGFGDVNIIGNRYCVQPIAGLLQQRKLLPVKYMANQFTIVLTLAKPETCMFTYKTPTVAPSYTVGNVNLICETLNFDPTFDEMFLEGLRNGGVPIKFSSWRSYSFPTLATNQFLISERAKSIKALFAVLQRATPSFTVDNGATPFAPGVSQSQLNYQYQIGTKYYPATPVELAYPDGSSNGGAEAYCELAKALYTVGNYQLSSGVNKLRWGHGIYLDTDADRHNLDSYRNEAESDFTYAVVRQGSKNAFAVNSPNLTANAFGQMGSQCFAQAICLETSTSADYSGLNAEEASTIILKNSYTAQPGSVGTGFVNESYTLLTTPVQFNTVVFAYIDKMIVLGENNTLTLLE